MATHILLIADDPDQSQLFTLVLQRAGHQVTAVAYAQAALEQLRTTPFDLIFTDYLLPDINGDELIPIIRKTVNTKIVLMSNHVDAQYIARRAQADGCFPKDDIFKLIRLVDELLTDNSSNGSHLPASA